jgi:hypothetical protein
MKTILDVWEQNGFPSGAKLWAILKKQGLTKGVNRKQVDALIAGKAVSQLHHRPVKKKYSHISTTAPGVMYNADLLDMTPYARANHGVKWICLCIDVFSRRAAAVGMKNKTAPIAADALRECFDLLSDVPPKILLTDQGSEWAGATARMLDKMKVIHKKAEVGDHNRLGLVDRFSQTVKRWIAKLMTHKQTQSYIDNLPKLILQYNASPHSSLGDRSPDEAWQYPSETRNYHYEKIQKALTGKRPSKREIVVGDSVRVLNLKKVFDKGYHVKYSLTTHKVVEKKGLNYILDNGRFYRAARLLKVPPREEEPEAPKEDVSKKARQERRKEVILQTEGIEQSNRRSGLRSRKPQSQLEDVRYGRVRY